MRKPVVTRTIKSTEVKVLCLDINTAEPCNKTVILPRTYKNVDAMLKMAKAEIDTEEIKAVAVVDSAVKLKKYGMSEASFIKNAEFSEEVTEDEEANE